MQIETFRYDGNKKTWSIAAFPDLDSENTLVLLFAAPEFRNYPDILLELTHHYPSSKIIGCSTAGEIAGSFIFDHSISVAVVKFEKTRLKVAIQNIPNVESSFEAGKALVHALEDNQLRSVFVLSDGLHVNGSELVKGINSLAGENLTITGGLAGDGKDFKNTWIIFNNQIVSKHAVALGLYGDNVHISHGSRGGWDIFGPERRITRSKNNILYELDGKPALTLYKEYLGEQQSGLPATGLLFPLAIRSNSSDKKHLVRTILGIDEANNALIFAGDVPVGYFAQLMRANFDRLITGASEASQIAYDGQKSHEKSPCLLIAISCVGRRLLLGERTEEETELTLDAFPEGTQQIGYYSYGEISPFTTGSCDLHNQTMTLTGISESN